MPSLFFDSKMMELFAFLVVAFCFSRLAIRFLLGLAFTRFATRRRLVVGGIKPRTLENDLGGGDHPFHGLFPAFGAGLQRLVVKRLVLLELHTT